VVNEIADRLPVTLELLLLSGIFTLAVGVPLGIIAAISRNSLLDYVVRTASVIGLSIPAFWLGTMLLLLPALWFGWAPPTDYRPIWESPWHNIQQFAFPAVALSLATAATVVRLTRAAVLDVQSQDYIRTAWGKGLRQRQIVVRHILRNAMVPVTSFVGIQLITLIGGAVVVERLFNIDGLGQLLFTGVFSRDYALVQALVLLIGVLVLSMNVAVDVINMRLDPRVRSA
jgi:peptide/nickel transport system permease protein